MSWLGFKRVCQANLADISALPIKIVLENLSNLLVILIVKGDDYSTNAALQYN